MLLLKHEGVFVCIQHIQNLFLLLGCWISYLLYACSTSKPNMAMTHSDIATKPLLLKCITNMPCCHFLYEPICLSFFRLVMTPLENTSHYAKYFTVSLYTVQSHTILKILYVICLLYCIFSNLYKMSLNKISFCWWSKKEPLDVWEYILFFLL